MDQSLQRRLLVFFGVLLAFLTVLGGRLVQLQVTDEPKMAKRANASYTTKQTLPHSRGKIVDRNDELLAYDRPVTSVVVDKYRLLKPAAVPVVALGLAHREMRKDPEFLSLDQSEQSRRVMRKRREILNRQSGSDILNDHLAYAVETLSRPLGYRKEELMEKIMGTEQMDVVIAKNLREDIADNLQGMVSDLRIQGFRFEKARKRWYTMPDLAPHTIGYVNSKSKGMVGIEKSQNDYLTGKDGYRIYKRDRRGLPMAAHEGKLMPPVNGLDVQLTLDARLQAIAEEELQAGMEQFEAYRGAVVLIDPKSGEVLAMASAPSFDLNIKEGVAENSLSFASQAVYEPGSTFKVVAAAAAMNEGHANINTSIFCHWGNYRKGSVRIHDHGSYGDISVAKVMAKSSNIGAYQLAQMAGFDTFHDYAARFGFGSRTGIPIPNEGRGSVLHSDNPMDFSHLCYGYTVNVTPLQVAMAYGAIANGGTLMKPKLVKSVMMPSGQPIKVNQPEPVRRVMSERTAAQLREALAGVVRKGGTATQAAVPGFSVGGKTGTADRLDEKTNTYLKEENRNVVSFAGMLPADDPEFVCVVVIDDPMTTKVKRYGGLIAAPIFSRVSQRAARYLNLTPDLKLDTGDELAHTAD